MGAGKACSISGGNMDKEEAIFQNRIIELADRSYGQSCYTFTEFLNLSQIDLCLRLVNRLNYVGMTFFGGTKDCDRRVLRFGNPEDLGYEEPFPIVCLKIEPLAEKFSKELTHRDYLGALMNLGIERENLGDIIVLGKTAYLFCLKRIAPYLMEELHQAGRNPIRASLTEPPGELLRREKKEETILASSVRIDGIISKLYHLSRNESLELFQAKKIFINGRLGENRSNLLKEGDIVSVRGYGKFQFEGVLHETKKGRLAVKIGVYQ